MKLFIEREGSPVVGLYNGCMVTIIGILTLLMVIGIARGLMKDEPEPGEQIGVLEGPVLVSVEPDQCLILIQGEDGAPDYRLGEGEECRP